MLLREFDDRMGWSKWSSRSCAEWRAWRSGMTLSTAREHVRTAQALRDLPEISRAFADGRISYSKARALTRATPLHDEQSLKGRFVPGVAPTARSTSAAPTAA